MCDKNFVWKLLSTENSWRPRVTEIITRYRKMLAPSRGRILSGYIQQIIKIFHRRYLTARPHCSRSCLSATVNTVRPRIKSHLCDYEPSAYVYFLRLFPRCNIRKFNFFSLGVSALSDRQHGGTILEESMLIRNSRSPAGKTEIKTKNSGHNLVLLRSQYKTILASSK